jgi:hypothetical protein
MLGIVPSTSTRAPRAAIGGKLHTSGAFIVRFVIVTYGGVGDLRFVIANLSFEIGHFRNDQ